MRAEKGLEVKKHLLVTRYDPDRVKRNEMLSIEDIQEILAVPLLGIIPESRAILSASNQGIPVTLYNKSDAKFAYCSAVNKLLGEENTSEGKAKGKYFKFLEKLKLVRSPSHEYS